MTAATFAQEPARPDTSFTENWPCFRGPTGQGLVPAGEWPELWDGVTGDGVLWKTPVPLPGNSSPVVWGDRIFLTAATVESQEILCFHRDNGELLWRTRVTAPRAHDVRDLEIFEDTGYAASTPVTDGERLYALFATADIAAVDVIDGGLAWARNLGDPDNVYGLATSLVLHDKMVIFQFDRGGDARDELSSLLAIDTGSGATLWSIPREVDASWSTPILVETDAGLELIAAGDPWVISYDLDARAERWRVRGLSGDVAPLPIVAGGMVIVTNEYADMLAIRLGGEGDVTETHIAWRAEDGLSDAPSPLSDGQYVLQAHSMGELTCFDLETGELLWSEDLPSPSMWASPILAGNTVYLFAQDGKCYLMELGKALELRDGGSIGEKISATPAFADGCIYVRSESHLYAIGEEGKTSSPSER